MTLSTLPAGPLAVQVHVSLDWSGPTHYDLASKPPCRCCGVATIYRDDQGQPCDQRCAEQELETAVLEAAHRLLTGDAVAVLS